MTVSHNRAAKENPTMKVRTKNPESGVALFFSLFALLLLTAIGAAMIFMAGTETTINSNYRQEQVAYFAAKAGVEEARARMMQSDPNTMYVAGGLLDPLTAAAPTTGNHMIYYLVNNGNVANAVQPWSSTNAYADDEVCNDGYGLGLSSTSPGIRCALTNLPANSYVSYNSTLPFSGTSGAISYKWVRIAPKVNNSVTYLTNASSSTAALSYYDVNSGKTLGNIICWDGQEELVLNTPTYTLCSQMKNAAGSPLTNVYLITAMGVSSNSNARKVVQSEAALQPTTPFIYGLYATSNACPAILFNGNNPTTDSYTTAGGGTYASTKTNTGGDIGSNGSINIGNGNIGGIVGVLQAPPAGNGNCATPLTEGPNGACENQGSVQCTSSCPSGVSSACYLPIGYTFPTPPAPNPLPPNTSYSPPSCGGKKSGNCMVPGTYGNITVNGTLTIAPGVYNINSISMGGNGQIIVNPPGAVTINIGGTGQANPLAIAGNGITDDTNPNDFIINYAGTSTVSIAGNGDVTAILNAPNATLTQQGNGNWYGSMLVSSATIGGNAFFHYDKAAALAPNNNGYFTMLSYREIEY